RRFRRSSSFLPEREIHLSRKTKTSRKAGGRPTRRHRYLSRDAGSLPIGGAHDVAVGGAGRYPCGVLSTFSRLRELPYPVAEYIQTGAHVWRRVLLIRFVLDADIAGELYLAQRPEHTADVERAPAEDDIGSRLIVVVLEVQAEVAGAHVANLLSRVEFAI